MPSLFSFRRLFLGHCYSLPRQQHFLRQGALMPRYKAVRSGASLFDAVRGARSRVVGSTFSLVGFLGAQVLMPNLFTLQMAQATEQARIPLPLHQAPPPAWAAERERHEVSIKRAADKRAGALRHAVQLTRSRHVLLAQNTLFADGMASPASQHQGYGVGRIIPSAPPGCTDCEVTMQKLNLKRVPTEKELRMAGQLGGALDPVRPAEPTRIVARLKAVLQAKGVTADLTDLSPATLQNDVAVLQDPNSTPDQKLVALARRKVKRVQDINVSFGEAIEEWNKHNFRHAAEMFRQHVKDFPDSPWNGEATLHLGCDAKYNGRFVEAEQIYGDLLKSSSSDTTKSTFSFRMQQMSRRVALVRSAGGTTTNVPAATTLSTPADVARLATALHAAPQLQQVINAADEQTDESFDIHQKAKARWADLDLSTGRFADARDKLLDLLKTDTDWHRRTWALHWLTTVSLYIHNARDLRACGVQALGAVLASLGKTDASVKLAALKPPRDAGFSLAELETLSRRYGAPMRGFRAQGKVGERAARLASLPLPLVLHYDFGGPRHETTTVTKQTISKGKTGALKVLPIKVSNLKNSNRAIKTATLRLAAAHEADLYHVRGTSGHFVVVRRVDTQKRQVTLFDPQGRRTYCMGFIALDREWSGTGLVLTQAPSQRTQVTTSSGVPSPTSPSTTSQSGDRVAFLSESEMRAIIGGCCGQYSQPIGTGCSSENDSVNDGSCGSAEMGEEVSDYGSPAISVNRANFNVHISDTPMWYDTSKGPNVEIRMAYNSQDALTQSNPFGNKWMFNYGMYITEDTTAGGGQVVVFKADGSQESYTPDGSGGYLPPVGIYNTLVKTSATHYEITLQKGGKEIFDIPTGTASLQPFLTQLVDRWGYALTFTYTDIGPNTRLTKITDAQGKETNLFYDGGGHVVMVQDPFGRQASFSYDGYGNMVEAVDMDGNAFQYTYDSDISVTQVNTAQGAWHLHYDSATNYYVRTMTVSDPAGQSERWYYIRWNYYSHTDKKGIEQFYDVGVGADGKGHTTRLLIPGIPYNGSVESDEGVIKRTAYDPGNAKPSSVMDETGKTGSLTYNTLGQVTSATDAKGNTTLVNYATNGAANGLDVTSIVDADNVTVFNAQYNSAHQPTQTTDANGRVTTMTYTPWGAPATASNDGHTATFNYNSGGQLTSVARDSTPVVAYTYDEIGRVKTATDITQQTLTYEYNNLDQVTKVTYPDSTSATCDYVSGGMPGVVTDRAGRKTYYDYDELKHLTRVQDSAGNSAEMDYDANGRPVLLTDTRGGLTRWTYDNRGRVVRKTLTDGTSESYAYAQGRVAAMRDARGHVTHYNYDDNGNVTEVDYQTLPSIYITYNAMNAPVTMQDGLGTTSFGYDATGHMTNVGGLFANDTVSYSFDAQNRRTGMHINNTDATTYAYDALSRLQSVNSAVSGTFGYSYVGDTSLLSQFTMPDGSHTNYGYDSLNRLTQIANQTGSNALISSYNYGYDTRDIKTFAESQVGTDALQHVNFGYDSLNQLTSETSQETPTPQLQRTYAYDAMGNRTQTSGRTFSYTFQSQYATNGLNQTTAHSDSSDNGNTWVSTALGYDAGGNLTTQATGQGGKTYTYDELDRLSQVVTRNEQTGAYVAKTTFAYDGFNRLRITDDYLWSSTANNGQGGWVSNGEKRRIYDGMLVVQERDGNNAITAQYTRVGTIGGLLSRTTQDGTFYYHYDGRGNVTQLTDANGATVAKYVYDGFGNEVSESGTQASANPFRYQTKELIQSCNLYDFGFRFYAPNLGKWINRDPIREAGGLNIYGYCGNDPINSHDALGLSVATFLAGLWSGFSGSLAIALLIDAAIAASGGTVAALLPALLAIVGGEQLIDAIYHLMHDDMCADDRDFKIGQLLGGILGGMAAGGISDTFDDPIEPSNGNPDCGAPGGGCFVAGTLVTMADGNLKPIEKVKVGDSVLSRDYATGKTAGQKVQEVKVRHVAATLVVTLSTGEKIETTKEHPVYVVGEGFVPAGRLAIGNSIVTRAGPTTHEHLLAQPVSLAPIEQVLVVKVEVKSQPNTVYNFTVANFHTYFVGKSALWVHNVDCTHNAIATDHEINGKPIPDDLDDALPLDEDGNATVGDFINYLTSTYGKPIKSGSLSHVEGQLLAGGENTTAVIFGSGGGSGHAFNGMSNGDSVSFFDKTDGSYGSVDPGFLNYSKYGYIITNK